MRWKIFQSQQCSRSRKSCSCSLGKILSDKVIISEFLSEHTYAAEATIQFSDLTKEELNLLKLTVDPDFLRVFLKQLRKGTFIPIEQGGLADDEDHLRIIWSQNLTENELP